MKFRFSYQKGGCTPSCPGNAIDGITIAIIQKSHLKLDFLLQGKDFSRGDRVLMGCFLVAVALVLTSCHFLTSTIVWCGKRMIFF